MSAAIGGDRRAITALYGEYHRMLVRYLRPQAPGFGEELAEATWLTVAKKLKGFRGTQRAFRILLLSAADDQVSGHNQQRRRTAQHRSRPRVIDLRSSPVGDDPVTDAAIAELLHGLSSHQAHILLLRVVGGLSAPETGQLLGEKPTTIRLTEHEALQQISRRLQTPSNSSPPYLTRQLRHS